MPEPTASTPNRKSGLPPGTILGPDGKPCKVCVGADWKSWTNVKGTARSTPSDSTKPSSSPVALAVATGTALSSMGDISSATESHVECPVDGPQLGRATWTFLHTAAAYYPTKPTPIQKTSMLSLLNSLPITYPCSHCATHFGETMKANPPNVSDRSALSRWLCQRHNDVNELLGKANFDCDKTDERWLSGPADGRCD